MMFDKHANLKPSLESALVEGYYVSIVGLNEAIIRNIFKNRKSMI